MPHTLIVGDTKLDRPGLIDSPCAADGKFAFQTNSNFFAPKLKPSWGLVCDFAKALSATNFEREFSFGVSEPSLRVTGAHPSLTGHNTVFFTITYSQLSFFSNCYSARAM